MWKGWRSRFCYWGRMLQQEDRWTCQWQQKQAAWKQLPSSMPFDLAWSQKCRPFLRWVTLLQIRGSRKSLPRKVQRLVFWFPLQAAKLTTKISNGNSPPGGMTYDLKRWSWISTYARGWILQVSECHPWRDGSPCEFSCFHSRRIEKTLQAVKT